MDGYSCTAGRPVETEKVCGGLERPRHRKSTAYQSGGRTQEDGEDGAAELSKTRCKKGKHPLLLGCRASRVGVQCRSSTT